ncbi:FecCD family ABC transporter permease [Streptococcus chenjunshii]|uniref:Iron ABC transporter permease n=1 Tax=Streptococcus chenjunshii TaxID=2173853 RepID=A0ABX9L4L6_9STRE|nr:iron ABC transporter permease [Streptococcus chenjunshii]RFU50757.1 iron ABC transporter permease [Streptococcus chenjunshii]
MISHKQIKLRFASLLLLFIFIFILSLSVGYANSSLGDSLAVFGGSKSHLMLLIITKIRLPRIIACILGGASLSLAGVLLQTLTKNPLADSGILGINTGAGLAVAFAVGLTDFSDPAAVGMTPIFAMLGGWTTIMAVYLISRKKNHGISPVRLIVTGVGVSSMLSGVMVTIISRLDDYKMSYIVEWLSGKVTGGNWTMLGLFAPVLILLWVLTYSRSQALNIMNLNEQTALALGLQLQKERLYILMLSTALAAFSVILVGNITFVGLVAGHITRRIFGSNHHLVLPASVFVGILILLSADTIGRVLLVGTGIPTGLVVSVIGAPYFLYLMLKTAA